MAELHAVRGTEDAFPERAEKYAWLEGHFRQLLTSHGFGQIRTPVLEPTELYVRGVGAYTDIVSKEMYTLQDRKGRSITLRPEGTAGVVRAVLERGSSSQVGLQKYYYIGPMFRYERPQAGRLRQHTQIGVEIFGSPQPAVEAQLLSFLHDAFTGLGLSDIHMVLNNVGCKDCRPVYSAQLQEFLRGVKDNLCADCQLRMERNPLRVFDCKVPGCKEQLKNAPVVAGALCPVCQDHARRLEDFLGQLQIPYVVDPRLVRGLDYYTRTVFECKYSGLGAQDTVAAGGRYDYLVEEIGGPATPAAGFGMGLERLLLTLEQAGAPVPGVPRLDYYIVVQREDFYAYALELERKLSVIGACALFEPEGRSLKAQMRRAGGLNARYVLILGESEAENATVTVRALETGQQVTAPREVFGLATLREGLEEELVKLLASAPARAEQGRE